jgi:curved DNA-binding protein CbpA
MAAGQFRALGTPEIDAVWRWREALGVPEHASPEDIKRAYRRAVKQAHPDLNPGDATAAAHFRHLHEAYEALITIARRSAANDFTDVWEGQL